MEIDRRLFFAALGGAAAVEAMSPEARADALEDYMSQQLDNAVEANQEKEKFPTVKELEAEIETRKYRRGAGTLFVSAVANVKKLEPLPAHPTLLDFFRLRFAPANHVLQSATRAMKNGMTEEIILACLLHDVVQTLIKPDHGWWGAQLFEPYVPEKTTFAIRYHQALRFYADPQAGYEYPDLYHRMFGVDYTVAEGVETASQLSAVSSVGCDEIQGWLVSPACPLDEFLEFWKGWAHRPLALVDQVRALGAA